MDEQGVLTAVLRRARAQDEVVTTRDAAAAGMTDTAVRRLLRQGRWVRLLRGSYLVEPTREGALLERSWARSAVLTVLGAVLGLASAARLHGVSGVRAPACPQVVVPPGSERRRRTDLEPHARVLGAGDVVTAGGIALTSGVRTLVDLVPQLSRLDAIAVMDPALRIGLVDRDGITRAASTVRGRRGSLAVADLWALADHRAESPLESRVRVRCLDGGVVPDDLQVVIRDEHGHVVGRGDLGFRRRTRPDRRWLILEADGQAVHSSPDALYRDRWRANTMVALGHDLVRCTWADMLTPRSVPGIVRAPL